MDTAAVRNRSTAKAFHIVDLWSVMHGGLSPDTTADLTKLSLSPCWVLLTATHRQGCNLAVTLTVCALSSPCCEPAEHRAVQSPDPVVLNPDRFHEAVYHAAGLFRAWVPDTGVETLQSCIKYSTSKYQYQYPVQQDCWKLAINVLHNSGVPCKSIF